jgi:hypothetical protein
VFLLFPVSIAIAILRYHLYDIDRLLSRTLTYGLLTIALGTLYAGTAVILGQALNPQVGTPRLLWPSPHYWWRRSSGRSSIGSRTWSTGTSIGAAMMRPRPSRGPRPGCATRSTSTHSRPSCWTWSTAPCNRLRHPCGSDLLLADPRPKAIWPVTLRHDQSDLGDQTLRSRRRLG